MSELATPEMEDIEYGSMKSGNRATVVPVGQKYMQIGSCVSAFGLILSLALGGGVAVEGRPNAVFIDYASPADWTFAIWGIIYTLIFGFVLY